MVYICCVPNCNSRSSDVKTYTFPVADNIVYDIWLKRVGNKKLENYDPKHVKRNYRVCQKHFSSFSIVPPEFASRRRLKARSVPTLFLPEFNEEPTRENSLLPYSPTIYNLASAIGMKSREKSDTNRQPSSDSTAETRVPSLIPPNPKASTLIGQQSKGTGNAGSSNAIDTFLAALNNDFEKSKSLKALPPVSSKRKLCDEEEKAVPIDLHVPSTKENVQGDKSSEKIEQGSEILRLSPENEEPSTIKWINLTSLDNLEELEAVKPVMMANHHHVDFPGFGRTLQFDSKLNSLHSRTNYFKYMRNQLVAYTVCGDEIVQVTAAIIIDDTDEAQESVFKKLCTKL